MLCKLETIDPEAKTAINRNDTNRNRFLVKFFILPEGTPFMA
jgi:hypothetical protein